MTPTGIIFSRTEARAYVKRENLRVFKRWCQKWGVRSVAYGRYAKATLDLALAREAGIEHTPTTLRRKQEQLRASTGRVA